jgi:uncharacterized glyoxalase superfamily protein PhnB
MGFSCIYLEKNVDDFLKTFTSVSEIAKKSTQGSIGHAEVRIGNSVIIVVYAQGEEYKSMTAGALHLFSWIYTSEILQQ